MSELDEIVRAQKQGASRGIYSVCSADPLVIEAACHQALHDGTAVLVEATSNQVDQYGGYTGMRPVEFRDHVLGIADAVGLRRERVILGGDHLGPNTWSSGPSDTAMAEARTLVAEYARAGVEKIHIDCSFLCADDPTPMRDDVAAARTADLIQVAIDNAIADCRFVIGTEVPIPGGHQEALGRLIPTPASAARATIEAHKKAFDIAGLAHVWPKVMGLVVQPAVEFDQKSVVDYDPARTVELQSVLDDEPNLVFEAHSTDYQTGAALSHLVKDHWAILKVGPGLTFALREGLFALAHIEQALLPETQWSRLPEAVEQAMVDNPRHWESYYTGTPREQALERVYSYSDRIRYYWPVESVAAARERLMSNLAEIDVPVPLLSQYLPNQYHRVRSGNLLSSAKDLLIDKVRDAIRPYAAACHPRIC